MHICGKRCRNTLYAWTRVSVSSHLRRAPLSVNPLPDPYLLATTQVANERQFFDHVKETLQSVSRPGHDAWADFLKYLNLYSNDVLNRKDMLNMLEDIFGKHKVHRHPPSPCRSTLSCTLTCRKA